MLTLTQIESDLVAALKARDQHTADTLRALKTRVQNEQIAQMKDLEGDSLIALVQSEVKKRKEAAASFTQGGRSDLAERELSEVAILGRYLPEQASEQEIQAVIDALLAEGVFTVKDFGVLMGKLKEKFGATADGGTISRLLKEKLK